MTDDGLIKLQYIPTKMDENPADILMKGLNPVKHDKCVEMVGLRRDVN